MLCTDDSSSMRPFFGQHQWLSGELVRRWGYQMQLSELQAQKSFGTRREEFRGGSCAVRIPAFVSCTHTWKLYGTEMGRAGWGSFRLFEGSMGGVFRFSISFPCGEGGEIQDSDQGLRLVLQGFVFHFSCVIYRGARGKHECIGHCRVAVVAFIAMDGVCIRPSPGPLGPAIGPLNMCATSSGMCEACFVGEMGSVLWIEGMAFW